jgi:hypothetical protein
LEAKLAAWPVLLREDGDIDFFSERGDDEEYGNVLREFRK